MRLIILSLLILSGCATELTQSQRIERQIESDNRDLCINSGGVWFKGHMDMRYTCTDKESVRGMLRNIGA